MLTQLTLALLMALGTLASPLSLSRRHIQLHERAGPEFIITVTNNCPDTIHAATYSISGGFTMSQESAVFTINHGDSADIHTAYNGIGMRLSGNADWPLGDQWKLQPLFEYGFSAFNGIEGTAYDISLMDYVKAGPVTGGLKVVPANSACETKVCTPSNCPKDQGWTSPSDPSGADTVCYHGRGDFHVTFCP